MRNLLLAPFCLVYQLLPTVVAVVAAFSAVLHCPFVAGNLGELAIWIGDIFDRVPDHLLL